MKYKVSTPVRSKRQLESCQLSMMPLTKPFKNFYSSKEGKAEIRRMLFSKFLKFSKVLV